jgi:ABC-type Zn uptake system ZnuABC Zn-binding protein ZnuA
MNGLGLDDWLARLATNVETGAPIVRLGEDLAGWTTSAAGGQSGGEPASLAGRHARGAVRRADPRRALDSAQPASADEIGTSARVPRGSGTLDAQVRSELATVPGRPLVVSFHDAFPYYARAYGLTVVGTVVRAPGQEPSAGEVGALVDAIRAADVSAILAEAQFSDAVVQAIADETGAVVVTELYSDSLGDPPVDTFEGLSRWNTDRSVAGLR